MILIEHHVMVKVNNISRFFRDEIEIFSNLVVRDEIKICFFYISCFETRSRICFSTSRISRRGRETKQLILEVEQEFSMLILARHFEIENSRQCLVWILISYSLKDFLPFQSWFEKSIDSCVMDGDSECQVLTFSPFSFFHLSNLFTFLIFSPFSFSYLSHFLTFYVFMQFHPF